MAAHDYLRVPEVLSGLAEEGVLGLKACLAVEPAMAGEQLYGHVQQRRMKKHPSSSSCASHPGCPADS